MLVIGLSSITDYARRCKEQFYRYVIDKFLDYNYSENLFMTESKEKVHSRDRMAVGSEMLAAWHIEGAVSALGWGVVDFLVNAVRYNAAMLFSDKGVRTEVTEQRTKDMLKNLFT